jgi:hypothetical protein
MEKRETIRTMVRGTYDLQKLRIQMGNRIVANFRAKMGQAPGEKTETLDDDKLMLLAELKARYKRLTDGVATFPRQATFTGDDLISDYSELCLLRHYLTIERSEVEHFRDFEKALREFPVWTQFMEGVRGVGPAIAGVIISEIDIAKCKYASSIWAYAGLDVAADGRGRSRRKEHLVEREFTDKDGKPATRQGVTFNPFLKTKLIGVLGPSFVKQPADRCPYRGVYDNYKHRLETDPKHADKSKGHRHNMAVRYMVKRFLADLYAAWRTLEGLPVQPEYHEAKQGHTHAA